MPGRGPGRYVAPLALIAVILAMVMIVGSSGGGDDEETATSGTTATQTTTGSGRSRRPPKTYRVREGDTLASIALKTGITEERLSILNPDLDPNAIQVGQRIRLRP